MNRDIIKEIKEICNFALLIVSIALIFWIVGIFLMSFQNNNTEQECIFLGVKWETGREYILNGVKCELISIDENEDITYFRFNKQ